MNHPDPLPGNETLMASTLLVATLLFSVFKLGAMLSRPKAARRQPRPPRGQYRNGDPIFTDPDGRTPATTRPRR